MSRTDSNVKRLVVECIKHYVYSQVFQISDIKQYGQVLFYVWVTRVVLRFYRHWSIDRGLYQQKKRDDCYF